MEFRIRNFLLTHNFNGVGLVDYINDVSLDRRYKAKWLAAEVDGEGRKRSGIIYYKKQRWYFSCYPDKIDTVCVL